MELFKRFLKAVVLILVSYIFFALAAAFVIWFFATILFGQEWGFFTTWKYTYYILVTLGLLYRVIQTLKAYAVTRSLSRRLDMPFAAIDKAFQLRLDREKNPIEWDKHWVESNLRGYEMAKNLY